MFRPSHAKSTNTPARLADTPSKIPKTQSQSPFSSNVEIHARPSKRPRLSPVKRPRAASDGGKENTKVSRDEKAMMEDLLAGLDASVFDWSPSKSQQKSQVKIEEVKREVLSPIKARVGREDRIPLERLKPQLVSDVKDEAAIDAVLPLKQELKVDQGGIGDPDEGVFDDLDDLADIDFGDLSAFDDDLLPVPVPKTRYPILDPAVPTVPPGYKPTPWIRCTVEFAYEGLRFVDGVLPPRKTLEETSVEAGQGIPFGKTLVVNTKEDNALRVVHLRESWVMTPIKRGDTINIIIPDISATPLVVSSKCPSSYLILYPDLLITMTSIANAMPCPRRPILNSLLKLSGPQSKNVVYGNLLHGLLQSALQEQDFSPDATQTRLEALLKREDTRLDIWGAGLNVNDVAEELGRRARSGFATFGEKWVNGKPDEMGELHSMPGDAQDLLSITGLHEVEEDIWSPKWGLKGKVDASVQAAIVRKQIKPAYGRLPVSEVGSESEEHVAPLEIKTGRAVGLMAHRAQTMLYTLLMEDRYGVPVPAGLLYYSQLDSILRVEAKSNEVRSLIIARNELASYLNQKRKLVVPNISTSQEDGTGESSGELKVGDRVNTTDVEDTFLPPTLDSERECKNCYAQDACMLYRKTPTSEDDPIANIYEEKVGNMTPADRDFFRKWENLLSVEEQDIGRFRSQLWTMGAEERGKTGRCFGNMIIQTYSNDLGKSLAKIHRHSYTFVRARIPSQGTASQRFDNRSLLSGHIAKGDPVSLSIEPGLFALERGYVLELTPDTVTVGVAHVIDTTALLARTSTRHAHRKVISDGDNPQNSVSPVVFRIDKDEMASGMQRMRNNLAQLFLPGGNEKLRRIVVDHVAPRFDDPDLSLRGADGKEIAVPDSFNSDQRVAMQRVLSAQDYALILGMPGTGKTTTIAEIIKAIVERGQSVLLASYTHSAVDTILMKLVNEDFGILRLGNVDKVHPDVQHLTLDSMNASKSIDELENRLMSPPVVACTCLAIDHPLFHRRRFDYCIIDEASQITLPTCLGPLRFADRFVLVGDHYQLPPIVKNPHARKAGLDISLFRFLSNKRPESVTSLTFQYRMNEDIMALSNKLIYEGRLRCGNESVAKKGLKVDMEGVKCKEHAATGCWVRDLLDERVKAVFVDTDGVPAREDRVGDLVQNSTEAVLVRQLAGAFTDGGVRPDDIAVITPYRQQIKCLTGLFRDLERVEILTADKSQGRDKDVILISLVRSSENGGIGELLRDWRRINVSFTRAKRKLVIFGSRSTLGKDKLMADFFDLMKDKKWIYTLKAGVHKMAGHELDEDLTQSIKGSEAKKGGLKPAGQADAAGQGRVGDRLMGGKAFAKEILAQQ